MLIYLGQYKAPWFHSWNSPRIRIKRKKVVRNNQDEEYLIWKITGIGIISVISTSKIRKIIAIKKNCIEKGAREKNWGLYPHSNGDIFSRSLKDLFPRREFNIIITLAITIEIMKISIITFFLGSIKLEALCTKYTKNVRASLIDWYI